MEQPVMSEDHAVDDTQDQETDPPPELADWWVWGVRKVAAVIADLLLAVRVVPILFAVLKGATWAFTRDSNELWGAGAGVAGFLAVWGGAMLLGRFSAERDSPDPERWFLGHRRAKRG
jgi:hypothetical protein